MEIVFFRILTAVGLLYFLRTHALRETISSKDVRKCFVPKDSGSCKRFVLAFYFNERKHRCLAFAYGGCGGNGNNFHKKKECEELCIPGSQPPRPPQPPVYNSPEDPFVIDFCTPGKDPGKCKAYFPRYYYNEETRECERFIYGGCGGNKNNFHNKSDCEKECVPAFDPIVLN